MDDSKSHEYSTIVREGGKRQVGVGQHGTGGQLITSRRSKLQISPTIESYIKSKNQSIVPLQGGVSGTPSPLRRDAYNMIRVPINDADLHVGQGPVIATHTNAAAQARPV